jgi:hypothetical protein
VLLPPLPPPPPPLVHNYTFMHVVPADAGTFLANLAQSWQVPRSQSKVGIVLVVSAQSWWGRQSSCGGHSPDWVGTGHISGREVIVHVGLARSWWVRLVLAGWHSSGGVRRVLMGLAQFWTEST